MLSRQTDRRCRVGWRPVWTLVAVATSGIAVPSPASLEAEEVAGGAQHVGQPSAPPLGVRLHLIGGYRVPNVRINSMNLFWGVGSIDTSPGSDKWLMVHPKSVLLELFEPGPMGTGEPEDWPELHLGRRLKVMAENEAYDASAAIWLDADTAMVSSRKHYRSSFDEGWLARASFSTGEETAYTIFSDENTEEQNFHVVQALGSGFVRLANDQWTSAQLPGLSYLLGRGGYDVLGSPLGPALGVWQEGRSTVEFLLDYPEEYPARRDAYYTYPDRDPLTVSRDRAQLPIWRLPDEVGGFWQAGDVGGIAYISLPGFNAFIASANQGRGLFDYRSQQGGPGVGRYFLVEEPAVFYGPDGGRGRGGHREEVLNAEYPAGTRATVAHVISPVHIEEVREGGREPWAVPTARFDWPREGLERYWNERGSRATTIGGLCWDEDRQVLWAAMMFPFPIIAAYRIEYGEHIPYSPPPVPPGWEGIFLPEETGDPVDLVDRPGVRENSEDELRPEAAWTARINSPAAGVLTVQQGQLYRLYLGILGRVPDQYGFHFWSRILARGNLTIGDIAGFFVRHAGEFIAAADNNEDGQVSDVELVDTILVNLLNRAPLDDEKTYWVRELRMAPRNEVVIDMLSTPAFLNSSYDLVAAFLLDGS